MKPILVSFPRAGRTWLMTMVGLNICYYEGVSARKANIKRRVVLDATHDYSDKSRKIRYNELPVNKDNYRKRQVILLLRDPRDIVVSAHLHAKYRKRVFKGTLTEYLRDPRFGIKKVIHFYNNWQSADVMELWYEELSKNPKQSLTAVLSYLNVPFNEDSLHEAVYLSKLENLQEWERTGYLEMPSASKPKHPDNIDSYYHRKGVVGDYVNHFSKRDLEYANEAMKEFKWTLPTKL